MSKNKVKNGYCSWKDSSCSDSVYYYVNFVIEVNRNAKMVCLQIGKNIIMYLHPCLENHQVPPAAKMGCIDDFQLREKLINPRSCRSMCQIWKDCMACQNWVSAYIACPQAQGAWLHVWKMCTCYQKQKNKQWSTSQTSRHACNLRANKSTCAR